MPPWYTCNHVTIYLVCRHHCRVCSSTNHSLRYIITCLQIYTMKNILKYCLCTKKRSKSQTPPENAALIDEISDTFSTFLSDLLVYLLKYPSQTIDLKILEGLGIRYESFDLDDTGFHAELHGHSFFVPMGLNKLKAFTPDLSQRETKGFLEDRLGDWGEVMKGRWYREVSQNNAQILCATLFVAFDNMRWKNGKQDQLSKHLSELTTYL